MSIFAYFLTFCFFSLPPPPSSFSVQHLFAQNKEKLIHAALLSILNRDIGELETMPVDDLEQQFHALRRLVASKVKKKKTLQTASHISFIFDNSHLIFLHFF